MSKNNFAYDEMMVHIPMCSHNNIKNVLVVGDVSDNFKQELSKHNIENLNFTQELDISGEFDIILYNKKAPTLEIMEQINKILEPKYGIFVCKGSFLVKNLEKFTQELKDIGKNFWISMPYNFGHNTLIFNSHKFHPQANIILQTSDLLSDCKYYNTELHNSCFVYPTYITKALTNIAKR
jgi:spermidine synthase